MDAPLITIFVRHTAACKYAGDEFNKRCGCKKHLRYSLKGKQYRVKTGQRSWAGAEQVKRKLEAQLTGRLTHVLTALGHELGSFFARRRGELKPSPLTKREHEVLALADAGLAVGTICERLTISRSTVKTHFEHIYAKLEVSNRTSAVAHALRGGLIQ